MKRKLLPLITALVCAITCTIGLAACSNGNKIANLWVSKTGETPVGQQTNYTIAYGEKPVLNYQLYLHYGNGDNKAIPLTDEKLTVKYAYYGHNESETLEQLPEEYLAGTYDITYIYNGDEGLNAHVIISVERAKTDTFTVQLEKTTWYMLDITPVPVIKTPKGLPVEYLYDQSLKTDDTNGNLMFYAMKKDAYDAFSDEQKTDYNFINDYYRQQSTLADKNIWYYSDGSEEYSAVGEYVLFATISETYNYTQVVTQARTYTVKDTFIGRTFTFRNIIVKDNSGNVVTDEENEIVAMAENMNTTNQGKTVICNANGEVRGTVDFGDKAFNDMSAEEVYKYTAYGPRLTITKDGKLFGEAVLEGKTLTMTVAAGGGFNWIITFTCN